MKGIQQMPSGGTLITEEGIPLYQAIVVKSALEMWMKHKIKANAAYTQKNMRAMIDKIVGRKTRNNQDALDAITLWIETKRAADAVEE